MVDYDYSVAYYGVSPGDCGQCSVENIGNSSECPMNTRVDGDDN